jgi:hypothetical protein
MLKGGGGNNGIGQAHPSISPQRDRSLNHLFGESDFRQRTHQLRQSFLCFRLQLVEARKSQDLDPSDAGDARFGTLHILRATCVGGIGRVDDDVAVANHFTRSAGWDDPGGWRVATPPHHQ